jgi:hypothetical protein
MKRVLIHSRADMNFTAQGRRCAVSRLCWTPPTCAGSGEGQKVGVSRQETTGTRRRQWEACVERQTKRDG